MMRTRRLSLAICFVVPVLTGLLVFALWTVEFRRTWNTVSQSTPVYDAPAEIQTEQVEYGQVAIAKFRVANRGGRDLLLDNFRTSCSCSGLEQLEADIYTPINSLTVGPNGSIEAAIRVTVSEITDKPKRVSFWATTTDPARPEVQIVVTVPRVVAGITITPENFTFGNVSIGAVIREEFDLYESSGTQRQITSITSSNPRITTTILPETQNTQIPNLGNRLGRFAAVVCTDTPGDVDAKLTMTTNLPGRPFPTIAIRGKIMAPVEVLPSVVVLPIKSSDGPIFHITCFCRSTANHPLKIEIESYTPGLDVQVLREHDDSVLRRVRIALKPNASPGALPHSVRLIAILDNARIPLEIPVTIEGSDQK